MDILTNGWRYDIGELKNEFENITIVNEYFEKRFMEFLCKKMGVNAKLTMEITQMPDSSYYLSQLCSEIEKYGIDNYKKIVNEYNRILEKLKQQGKLLTPQQIVDMTNKGEQDQNVEERFEI